MHFPCNVKEIKVKTFRKNIFFLALALMFTGVLSACGMKNKNQQEEEEKVPTKMVTEEKMPEIPDSDSVKIRSFRHGTMPIELKVPEAALITETEDSLTAETTGYYFYVFGLDRYRGAILDDALDILGLVNACETDETAYNEAKDILRLRDFTISSKESGTVYNNPDGSDGFGCQMSRMEYESQSGRKISGEGFLMVCDKNKGYGLYVVLGIMKDGKANIDIWNMLQSCAESLKQDTDGMGEFEEWTEVLADGTEIKAVFKKSTILNTDVDSNGICLYYDETGNGFFLIQHYIVVGQGTSEEYMKNLLDVLKKQEGVTATDIETVEGSMTYSKGTIAYDSDGVKMQEVIHACVDKNEVWVVDLVGSEEQIGLQKENLSLLLESLRKK